MNKDINTAINELITEKINELVRYLRKEDDEYKEYSVDLNNAYQKLQSELTSKQLKEVDIIQDALNNMNNKELSTMYIYAIKDIIELKKDDELIKYLLNE